MTKVTKVLMKVSSCKRADKPCINLTQGVSEYIDSRISELLVSVKSYTHFSSHITAYTVTAAQAVLLDPQALPENTI